MDLRTGIQRTAGSLGIDPIDLATAISYETAGTFDPTKRGPTTQWGQHRGLIQFGEPQAQKYGVNWDDPLGSQLGENGAVAQYLRDTGVKPGMGLLDIYSAINAGEVGRYNASDANNGGAPGTVRDKVERQMADHRRKAAALFDSPEAIGGDTMAALGKTQEQPMNLLGMSTQGQAPEPKEKWWNDDRRDRLIMGLEGMTLNPNRGLMMAAAQGLEERADGRKEAKATKEATQRRNRTAQWLAERGREDLAQAVAGGMIDGKSAVNEALKPASDNATAMQKNFEFLISRGIPEDQALEMARGGQTINVNSGSEVGTIPTGYQLYTDPETGARRLEPIAGGPVEAEARKAREQEKGRQTQTERAGSTVIQDLQRGLDLIPELSALAQDEGVVGGVTRTAAAEIPGAVANRITQFTESALSNVGLDTLQQMRENSPTGGALGQVPIQQQKRLEQVLGSLNINQPPPVLEANIKRVMNIYTDIIHGTAEERREAVRQGKMSDQQNAEINSYYYELPFDDRGRKRGSGGGRLKYNPETGDFE